MIEKQMSQQNPSILFMVFFGGPGETARVIPPLNPALLECMPSLRRNPTLFHVSQLHNVRIIEWKYSYYCE